MVGKTAHKTAEKMEISLYSHGDQHNSRDRAQFVDNALERTLQGRDWFGSHTGCLLDLYTGPAVAGCRATVPAG